MTRLREYATLAAPLLVRGEDDVPIVILAFGLSAGLRGGRLLALTISTQGGRTWWQAVDRLTFPSPIRQAPASGPARANAAKTAKVRLT